MNKNKKRVIGGVSFTDIETYKNALSVVRLSKFQELSRQEKKEFLRAMARGRVYLSASTNGTEKIAGVQYTIKHFGKMSGVVSVSTSVLDNAICQKRRLDPESICAKCFAALQMDCYKNMRPVFKRNLEILSGRLLEENEIPVILSDSGLLRGESFGDVQNAIQAANYLRIAAANPWQKFAVWTKNPAFYREALRLELCEKTDNCSIVLSSRYINKCDNIAPEDMHFIDHVFTVYNDAGMAAQGVNINCGARSCATCRKCYEKKDILYISEKLK